MSSLRFREVRPGDAEYAADVMTALRPTAPLDPHVLRHVWEHPPRNLRVERFLAERGRESAGFAVIERSAEGPADRDATFGGELTPELRTAEALDELIAFVERRAFADGAGIVRSSANEDDPFRAEVLTKRGYAEDRHSRRWELDLVSERERIERQARLSRERMRREGIRILTLAEDRDPARYEKIWRMSEEASDDVPTTLPRTRETLDDYLAFFRAPDIIEDRVWIAREGDAIVGISVLAYPPVRGVVGTAWTGTVRRIRGRGVARALKCETLVQAIGLGVPRVRTGNDGANAPILHINETMGYRPIPGRIDFLKRATGAAAAG